MTHGRGLLTGFVIAAALVAGPAHAQDSDTQRARTLFDEAGELERQGQWSPAQEKLRAALRIRETPHLHYALGWALENDDKLLEAKIEYETAARLAAQRPGAEEVTRLASARLAEVEKKTPLVQVHVAGGSQAGARVIVDGRTTPLVNETATVPVNPGSRVIRVERSGRVPNEQLVYVPRGMLRVVEVRAEDSVASRTGEHDRHDGATPPGKRSRDRSSPDADHDTRPLPVLPLVLAATGTVMFIGGAALFASSSGDASDRDDYMHRWCDATACANGTTATLPESAEATQYRQAANDAAARGNTKQIVGATLGGIGIAGAAVGAYLLFRDRRASDEHVVREPHPRDAAKPRSKRAEALPIVAPLPGGAMAGATIVF